jgi:hypothetical protein
MTFQHFGEMLIKQTRKEWEEERALARERNLKNNSSLQTRSARFLE